MAGKKKKQKEEFNKSFSTALIALMWAGALLPFFGIVFLRYIRTDNSDLPSVSVLENQKEMLATTIFADDGMTEIGKYWKVNRTSVSYEDIYPGVMSALIATEDERFEKHSGIDARAFGRALAYMGKAGGASTITQQLAKLIFTLKEREDKNDLDEEEEGEGRTSEEQRKAEMTVIERRLYEKVKENVIALRLERRYTKREIITMYLNQFDFLHNAVGISSASRVYFNKKANELNVQEAATLVGMCKNPVLYNPYSYQVRNYRARLASQQGIDLAEVTEEAIQKAKTADSLRAVQRRNVVLFKWMENSEKDNQSLPIHISREEYDSIKQLPILTNYQKVDFKDGVAPYFRESLRKEIGKLLKEQDENGEYKYQKSNGTPYNVYEDGLRIYTTLNIDIQKHAERAVQKHLKNNLQKPFDANNRRSKNFPFAYDVKESTTEGIMARSRKRSDRYYHLKMRGWSEKEIEANFDEPTQMKIFSWDGDIDTLMTPNDSIRYYKNIMRASLLSIEPQTGFVKAWVGGPDINHFSYDHVAQGKRQVGSTIKPFIYSAGMQFGVVTPCETTPNISYCVDIPDGPRPEDVKQWCPRNAGQNMDGNPVTFARGLAQSMNNITVAVMARMGGVAGPEAVAKLLENLNIHLRKEDVVPALCLGVMDMSLKEMVGAQAAFVNRGIYNEPSAILRIEDRRGNLIYENEHLTKEAMSEDLAYATLSMMKQVVQSGTAASLRGTWRGDWGGVTQPTAGKTGTTQNNSDGWFMGLTPDLVTGVWVGAEDMTVRFRTMEWGQGARMALPIYGYLMQEVYKDPNIHISTADFEEPIGYRNSLFNCNNQDNTDGGSQDDDPFDL